MPWYSTSQQQFPKCFAVCLFTKKNKTVHDQMLNIVGFGKTFICLSTLFIWRNPNHICGMDWLITHHNLICSWRLCTCVGVRICKRMKLDKAVEIQTYCCVCSGTMLAKIRNVQIEMLMKTMENVNVQAVYKLREKPVFPLRYVSSTKIIAPLCCEIPVQKETVTSDHYQLFLEITFIL